MTTTSTTAYISRSPREQSGQNLPLLQQQALSAIQQYADQTWTNHNPTDPGITLLDVLAFIISDLSYQLEFPVRDLMAWPEEQSESAAPFWLAPDVLPSNTVTMTDYRRMIMDIPGIRAVFLSRSPVTDRWYVVIDTKSALLTKQQRLALADQVRQRFVTERNVDDDIAGLCFIQKHPVALKMKLLFGPLRDPVTTLVDVFTRLNEVISPEIPQQSLEGMLDAGETADLIFEGPYTENGIIQPESLETEAFPQSLFASDLIHVMHQVTSLKTVSQLIFQPLSDEGSSRLTLKEDEIQWQYQITTEDKEREGQAGNNQGLTELFPRSFSFDLKETLDLLSIEIDGQAYPLTDAQKKAILFKYHWPENTEEEDVASSVFPDLEAYQQGQYRELKKYQSLQYEFPVIYRLIDARLDAQIDSQSLARIMQLKGFLTLFDQVLADQFFQLETLKVLLALPDKQSFTVLARLFDKMLGSETLSQKEVKYFWEAVDNLPKTIVSQPVTDISGMKNLMGSYFNDYQTDGFQPDAETPFDATQLDRLNRGLSHLLARYAETTIDANLLQYDPVLSFYLDVLEAGMPENVALKLPALEAWMGGKNEPLLQRLVLLKQVTEKATILNDYPRLSRLRAGGYNYAGNPPRRNFSDSLKHRILSFLGVYQTEAMPLATNNKEGFYLTESILLWAGMPVPGSPPETSDIIPKDKDSEPVAVEKRTLYFVIPDWPTRFANAEFRNLLEEQILRETPAHLTCKVLYLPREQMSRFEQLYYDWRNAMTQCPFPVWDGEALLNPPNPEYLRWLRDTTKQLNEFFHTADSSCLSPIQYERKPIGQGIISDNFIIGYRPLPVLHPVTPVSQAYIHPDNINPVFYVNIKTPNSINPV
ncbi:hypothetical protein [Vibrio quintilis]|uniref:Uncharacterized protein n=1 Tax=Vibrio quintilis TaxID=1117707 RepID=A0A1M7YUV4_9VIBR|nr:hypothetical protein [Vibrio quintilis]SHO56460.1 hypothetical protein VQ7734_02229 [Vibrio quintilis]